MYHPSLLHNSTIERKIAAQQPADVSPRRQLEIALEVALQAQIIAKAADNGDLWIRAWRRAEDVRAQLA